MTDKNNESLQKDELKAAKKAAKEAKKLEKVKNFLKSVIQKDLLIEKYIKRFSYRQIKILSKVL
nr:hypothetical protein [Treponema putidum]